MTAKSSPLAFRGAGNRRSKAETWVLGIPAIGWIIASTVGTRQTQSLQNGHLSGYSTPMARNTYPGSKTEAGIVVAYNCNAPCGGWIVLYDRTKGAKLGLKGDIKETGKYILVHRPSNNCLFPFDKLTDAKEYARAAAKGEDHAGFLPRTTKPTRAEKEFADFKSKPAKPEPTPKEEEQQEQPADSEEPPAAPKEAPPPDFHLEFRRRMLEAFPPTTIVDKLNDLLNANKPVALTNLDTGEKETVDVPDWMAREKGIRIVVELNEGKAKERPDTKEPVKRSWEDLSRMCKASPKARQFLRQQLEQWDQESKATDAIRTSKTQA
jgi:hypothetical protein